VGRSSLIHTPDVAKEGNIQTMGTGGGIPIDGFPSTSVNSSRSWYVQSTMLDVFVGCSVSMMYHHPDLLTGSSLGLGYQLGAAAAAAAAASSPWRHVYTPGSPSTGAERRYRSRSPLQSASTLIPHQQHLSPLWSPTSAFSHPAAAGGFAEGSLSTIIF